MDTSRPTGEPSLAQIFECVLRIEAAISKVERPKQRKNQAAWRAQLPTIESLVMSRGYAHYSDAEKLGLNNTEWDRCASELIKTHPDWAINNVKHRKFLHLATFDLNQAELETLTLENYSSGDTKVLQYMVDRINRAGTLDVLNDLQENHPKTGEKWRNLLIYNLARYIKKCNIPIERETYIDRNQTKYSDVFKKKAP